MSVLVDSGQQFPTMRFRDFAWWASLYQGIRFLPLALQTIRERRLAPGYSFHLMDVNQIPMGISDGDLRYPASQGVLSTLAPLIVRLEDRRFYQHVGVDFRAIARAMVANLRALRIVQGGSTITQQLVRNTLLSPERSVLRKTLEIILALYVEKHYTKQEILILYCNHVYLGGGVRGFSAAAKTIFRRNLGALSNSQVCALLGLLRTPTRTHPSSESSDFLRRQEKIVSILRPASAEARWVSSPNPIQATRFKCPRFARIVRSELVHLTGSVPLDLKRVGITVSSSHQRALAESLLAATRSPGVTAAAGVILSLSEGDVLAEGSCKEGRDAEFSPAYFGSVQPGSTFKTFALLSALEQGLSLEQELVSAPFESACYKSSRGTPWRVRNYQDTYRGAITLLDAFRFSDNSAFARLVEILDIQRLTDVYRVFGLSRSQDVFPAIVLGAHLGGVSLLSLAAAYRALARGGCLARPRFVRYAEYLDGTFSYFPRESDRQTISSSWIARCVHRALEAAGPVISGLRYSGKTGTTRHGSLFAGYDDQVAAAIWVGYDRPVREGDPKAVGALAVFERTMNRLLGLRTDLLSI